MNNNNPTPIQSGPASPIQPAPQPSPQPAPVQIPPTSNKMVMWLIIGVVLIILLVGGIYLYLSRQAASNLQTSLTQTPAPVQENLENDLNAIDVGNLDKDFSSVDQDLQQL